MKSSIQGGFFCMKTQAEWYKVAVEKVILISFSPPLLRCLPSLRLAPHHLDRICFDFSLLCHSLMTGKSIGSWRQGWGRNWLPLLPLYLAWQFEAARNKHIIIPTTTNNNNNSPKKEREKTQLLTSVTKRFLWLCECKTNCPHASSFLFVGRWL